MWGLAQGVSQGPVGQASQLRVKRVLSLQLAVGRQTCQRSWQTVAPGGGAGGRGACCSHAESSCEIGTSQQGQKPLNMEAEGDGKPLPDNQ
jgi:hypothetical protein